jgi:hypothetical protein
MTTVSRATTAYTQVSSIPPGGLSTAGPGGSQVRDDVGAVVLQDPSGNQITVSQEDLNNPAVWIKNASGQWQAPQALYTVMGRVPPGGESSSAGTAQVVDDTGDVLLQDAQGNQIVVSNEDYANPARWTIISP